MTKNRQFKSKVLSRLIIAIALLLSVSTMCGILLGAKYAYAYSEEVTTLTNLNFASNGNQTNVYSNPSGWTKGLESTATSGAINLDYHNESFYLDANQLPSKLSDASDDHVLMINSKSSKSGSLPCVQYYTNNSSLKLSPYSSYKIVVWAQVLEGANASIYITGLDETIGFEKIDYSNANEWTAYTFYITTGIKEEQIKTELWLGAKPNKTSTGAVFFDNIEVFQISNDKTPNTQTLESEYISTPTNASDSVKYINLNESQNVSEFDGTFETNLSGWTKTNSQMETGTYAEIINQQTNSASIGKGITYLGTDLTKGNKNALVLYTDENVKSYFGLKSPEITVAMYETLKISVNVKVANLDGGNAYVRFVESDVLNASGNKVEAITPLTKEVAISSNSTNKFQNNYTTVSFYVKGRSLYETKFSLELCLGSSESKTSGVVAFDNITVEKISYNQYSSATTGSYVQKVDLQSNTENFGITNATFNNVEKPSKTLTYPLTPNGWTHSASDENDVIFGVINTYEPIYNLYSTQFEGIANPGNPEGFLGTDVDTNNILVMHNINRAYQTATSTKFDVEANKYYKLSFDYKLIATGEDANNDLLNIYVEDENNAVLHADENINDTNFAWKKYTIYVSTNSYTNELKIKISLGTENNQLKGVAYIDNVTLTQDSKMTKESYEEISKTSNVLDFEEGNFNLIKDNNTSIYTPLRYTGSLEVGENAGTGSSIALGGIIDGNNTEDEFIVENSPNNTNSLKYMMMIQTHGKATYSLTAKDSLSLTLDSYYKFTVDVKTMFSSNASSEEETYGAEFGLTEIDKKITGIIAEDWTTYTIYVKCTINAEVKLRFALTSLNTNTAGQVFFDNYTYEVVDADAYNVAELNNSSNSTFLFVNDTETEEEKNDNDSTPADLQTIWYVIPTLILAVALILALVSYLMKKVKIKKWEKKKVNEYDRERTLARDVIRMDAEKIRDENVKKLNSEINEIKEKLSELEQKHQDRLKNKRSSRREGVSKEAEKEFKQYAKIHTAYENKVASLEREIDNMNTPEYLLSVQHKLAIEKAKQERMNKEKAYEEHKKSKKAKKTK